MFSNWPEFSFSKYKSVPAAEGFNCRHIIIFGERQFWSIWEHLWQQQIFFIRIWKVFFLFQVLTLDPVTQVTTTCFCLCKVFLESHSFFWNFFMEWNVWQSQGLTYWYWVEQVHHGAWVHSNICLDCYQNVTKQINPGHQHNGVRPVFSKGWFASQRYDELDF